MMEGGFIRWIESENATTLNDAQEKEDDGDHEQYVNEAADGGAGHKSEEPEDDENDGDGGKHDAGGFVGDGEAAGQLI